MEKKNNRGIIILMGGIIGVLLVLCVLFATDTIRIEKKESSIKNEPNIEVGDKLTKVDDSKDWVYDATYTYDNKYTEFKRYSSDGDEKRTISYYGIDVETRVGTQYLSDLKVPFLNFKSNDAISVNNELLKLYNKYASKFDECAEESKNDNGPSCSQILTYRTYKYDNILSVVVINSTQATSTYVFEYNIYNFDLTTGNILSFDELVDKLGYNNDDIMDKITPLLKEKMDNDTDNQNVDLSTECHWSDDKEKYGTENCYDITKVLVENSIKDNSILFFTDNDGVLNILPILYYNYVQNGTVNHYLIKVNK